MDEIHVKAVLDYKGGAIVGAASEAEENAKTAFVSMVSSLLSSYKDVVHILPVSKLSGELLFHYIKI